MSENTIIVVLGAGYAGMIAAMRLAGKAKQARITLVNDGEDFIERVRLHQLAANQKIESRPIAKMIHRMGIDFVNGSVKQIDVQAQEITVRTGDAETRRISYDYLLYALGSKIDLDGIPGARQHAYALTPAGPRSAHELRVALGDLNAKGGQLAVVGGGPTGIEAAAEFAESYPHLHVSLITRSDLAASFGHKVQERIIQGLRRLNVTIVENTMVSMVSEHALRTEHGAVIPHDVCVWAGGFVAHDLAREAGIMVNARGQILVDPYMRSLSHPTVIAAGDAAQPEIEPGAPMRMAAYTAAISGAHAADCLSAILKGNQPKPLSFAYAGQGIALGRRNAVGFSNYPDDRPHTPILSGRLAVWVREFFVRFLANVPNYERRYPCFFVWPGKGRVRAAKGKAEGNAVERPPA